MNPELICPPYILWPRRVRAGSDPSSPDPRPVVARSELLSLVAQPVVSRSQPSSPKQHPSSPDPVPVVGRCVPVVARFFLNSCTHCCALRTCRRTLPAVVARCRPVIGHCGSVVAHCIPVVTRCGPVVATLLAPSRHPSARAL